MIASGTVVVVRRQSGTQLARVVADVGGELVSAYILSARSETWTRTPRPVHRSSIIGVADEHATTEQRRALLRAARRA